MDKRVKNLLATILISSSLYSESLRDTVEMTINTNPDIIAEYFNKKSFRKNIQEQQHDYYPTINFGIFTEESHTYDNPDNTGKSDGGKNGWNAFLKFEQVLYDGGLTPNEIEQYKHRYNNIKYTSKEKIETLILNITDTYSKLVSYQELIALDDFKIKVHHEYLKLAKDKEELSGELLDLYQVQSKIKAITDNYLEQEVAQQKALSLYKKLSGNELEGEICRPVINENNIPSTIQEAIDLALRNNNEIRAQHELIREQTSKVKLEESKFRPTLKFQVEGYWDNDIDLAENGRRDIYRARLQSDWNLYNGGKDSIAYEREKIKILKERKVLDSIKEQVTDKIKGSYNTYFKLKKRINNLKAFVLDNQNIVNIYQSQLADGSRTFLDVLNAETELFRTKVLLIELEFTLYSEYYNILKSLDKLSDTILEEKNQICKKFVLDEPFPELIKKDSQETEDELEDELELD
ncbi:MAG: TolC family protein [Arcobacteraceae bacterium]|nr:TolC family protein [Arcobacteraceae bacterium]